MDVWAIIVFLLTFHFWKGTPVREYVSGGGRGGKGWGCKEGACGSAGPGCMPARNGPGRFVVYHGGMPPTMCIWEEIGKAFVRFDKNIKTENIGSYRRNIERNNK
jgi:hypothetical protein